MGHSNTFISQIAYMLTLIRPLKSKIADDFEKQLKEMFAAYSIIHKEISNITYLIASGQVFHEDAIANFLVRHRKELKEQNIIDSDSREIG